MAKPDPTHRELNSGRLVHAGQWHAPGDRPEGPPDCFETEPLYRLTAPIPAPVVRTFTFALLRGRTSFHERDERPHAEVSADAFIRNCTTLMREHGWLPYESGEPGVGYILCPGDWVITLEDGRRRAESDGWFAERYQQL
jgi:hypothetical protein